MSKSKKEFIQTAAAWLGFALANALGLVLLSFFATIRDWGDSSISGDLRGFEAWQAQSIYAIGILMGLYVAIQIWFSIALFRPRRFVQKAALFIAVGVFSVWAGYALTIAARHSIEETAPNHFCQQTRMTTDLEGFCRVFNY